jgi:uncharacterized protein (TIRG00374 family)
MRATFRFATGVLISVLFLFLALRNVEWAKVLNAWRGASPLGLAAGALMAVACWGIGAIRWRVLLAPAPGLRIRDTFAYISIGYLANTVLPFRLGELARATLIGRKKGLGIGRALGSIAVERVFDLLTVIAITLWLALLMEIPPALQAGLASMIGLALVALAMLLALSLNQERLHRLTAVMARFVPHRVAERIMGLATSFAGGAGAIRRPARLAAVAGLSAALWAVAGVATLIWVRAFNLAAPWYAGYFVLVVVNLGSSIPSSPGYIGVYHYLAVLALSMWVPERGPALAYAIGTHALITVANISLGTFFLVREGVSLKGLGEQKV